jgi:hypothetical protein
LNAAVLVVALAAAGQPVPLETRPVPLDARNAARERVGCLLFRGGLEIRSRDARVGGLSGLELTGDGRLLAVTDQGNWLRARLLYSDGRLTGLDAAVLGALEGPDGQALRSKHEQDAESLARLPDGRYLIGFERWHRVWSWWEGGRPMPFAVPDGLESAPENAGAEALTVLPDGDVVIVTEELRGSWGVRGWRGLPGAWQAFETPAVGLEWPSGAATLPSGDVILLERGYTPQRGSVVRLRRLPAADLREGARVSGAVLAVLSAPLTVDNFEGVAAERGPSGEVRIYLVSDDNFSADQRSLLMMFVLDANCTSLTNDGGEHGQH